jgi:hypothetical protein
MLRTAVIQKCRKSDLDERPQAEQVWCLYSKDGKKLLGRHPSKESAQKQETAIQISKHATVRKCKPSERDPEHEELSEWQQIWCVVDRDDNLKGRHKSKDDAGKQESAIRMNAFTIRFWDGDTYKVDDLQTALSFVVEEFPTATISQPSIRNGSVQWTAKEGLRILARIRVSSSEVFYDEDHNRVTLFGGVTSPKNDVWKYTGESWIELPNEMELASLDDAGEVLFDLAGVINGLYEKRDTDSIQRFGSLVKDLVDLHTTLIVRSWE